MSVTSSGLTACPVGIPSTPSGVPTTLFVELSATFVNPSLPKFTYTPFAYILSAVMSNLP